MSHNLPTSNNFYSIQAIRQLEAIAINEFKIPGYELMQRAGAAVFSHLQNTYPLAKNLLICCGSGNNGGDGYVVAKLAHQAGFKVNVVSLVSADSLTGDAKNAWQDWHCLAIQELKFSPEKLQQCDIVIDALLGTGLQREVKGEWAKVIIAINNSSKPVISVDIPSGLNADTGGIAGLAIEATTTITFVGFKKGLLTHFAGDYCGEVILEDLSLPPGVYARIAPQGQRLSWENLKIFIKPRKSSAHKHLAGHVMILGGDKGMPGAVRLAGEAALRAGAGLVTVVSHPQHMAMVLAGRPELMFHAAQEQTQGQEFLSQAFLSQASVLIIGPGMGHSQWSKDLFSAGLAFAGPKVIDAGALRLLELEPEFNGDANTKEKNDWVLTPHPGEAAGLLSESSSWIQNDRFSSVQLLQQIYGGHIVLKGAGTLLQSPAEITRLCPYGNPGLASAGMGDVLSGVIAGLIAQGYNISLACQLAVCIHSLAGDRVAQLGETGLLASDLFPVIRQLVNLK